ncbi:MAG: hypothetical protein JJE27_02250 [Thermoleophilia bacterium]|nr:hypothetical protein [Thermoleophilia bacterium]
MSLADEFQQVTEALPEDWTDLEFDLRLGDESDYIEAATLLTQCNAQPYSRHGWHWRVLVANKFGHGAAPQAVHATLGLLDANAINGEIAVRQVRCGRAETVQMWGRPEAVRRELRARRGL